MLEQRTVLEIPVIPEEKIHGITIDEYEELRAGHQVASGNQQKWTEFTPFLNLSVFRMCGGEDW